MNTNTLLLPPTFILKGDRLTADHLWAVAAVAQGVSKANLLHPNIVAQSVSDAMEYHVRRMLVTCAFSVTFPAYTTDAWAKPHRLKSLLSPSLRDRTTFLDRDGSIWSTVYKYFEPMRTDLLRYSGGSPAGYPERLSRWFISTAWDVYMLILATKNRCETAINPYQTTSQIYALLKSKCEWGRESQARWAVLATLFRTYSVNETVPSLFVLRTDPQLFSERIDEILEDAYLLEASALRRLFGVRENITAVRRDFRKLLKFIVGNRSWAKGLLGLGSQGISLALGSGILLDEMSKIVNITKVKNYAPFLACPRETYVPMSYENQFIIEPIRSVLNGGSWSGGTILGGAVWFRDEEGL